MAELVLGPVLRYVDERRATVWLETDAACEVGVLDARARTFAVHGRHYALVVVEGLEPGTTTPYDVVLDGRVVWPLPDDPWPRPVVRTRRGPDTRIALGSCRVAAPRRPPWTRGADEHERGYGPDALAAFAHRLRDAPSGAWPDLLLFLGDQVYADEVAPRTRRFIRRRREPDRPPWEQVADFEEYARLYHESWTVPAVRWLLSTVPSAMIFDDHDLIDDWNISSAWLDEIRATGWWRERVVSGLVSYWVHQHLGNLAPEELATDPVVRRVRAEDDAGPLLDELALAADRDHTTIRWSFARDLGATRLVVVDSRAARVLDEHARDMLHHTTWRWLESALEHPARHYVVASSVPVLLPDSIAAVESWNERLVAGAWGPRIARWSEGLRRRLDLEHWPAFWRSLRRMLALLGRVADRPEAPASLTVCSGDVHHAYLARVRVGRAQAPVHQVVASPFRQTIPPPTARLYRFAVTWLGRRGGRVFGALFGPPTWTPSELLSPLVLDNHVATLELRGDSAHVLIETAATDETGRSVGLRGALSRRLA